jgi:hypothetical protein
MKLLSSTSDIISLEGRLLNYAKYLMPPANSSAVAALATHELIHVSHFGMHERLTPPFAAASAETAAYSRILWKPRDI